MIINWLNDVYVFVHNVGTDDGYGNTVTNYVDGDQFHAGLAPIVSNSHSDVKIAEQHKDEAMFHLVVIDTELHSGDLVKRVSDGVVFEVLSSTVNMTTPAQATEAMRHSQAMVRVVTVP